LTNADVILHVVDASGGTNEEGEPVEVGEHDPLEDVDFVEREMDRWLAGIVDRNWEGIERASRSPDFDIDEALTDTFTGVGASEADVAAILRDLDYPDAPTEWTDENRRELAGLLRERTKPIVTVANKADVAPEGNVERLEEAAEYLVPATAEGELMLRKAARAGVVDYDPGDPDFEIVGDVTGDQRQGLETVRDVTDDWGATGVQRSLNTAVYDVLDRITAYPVQQETRWEDGQGNVLPDAVLLRAGATPPDLAAAIHSDIADAYLHAIDAREGRRIGEDTQLDEGDVIKIVSAS
jgi:ribosome-binding ATPase YchF (GTP1/OBG family)